MPPSRTAKWVLPILALGVASVAALASAAAPAPGGPTVPAPALPGTEKGGLASVAHDRFEGRATASGELYNRNALTAAHRTLPFGTLVRVTNVQNRRSVIVRINDRGSNMGNRIIDLTPHAGQAIGLYGIAMTEVKLEVVGRSAARVPLPAADAGK